MKTNVVLAFVMLFLNFNILCAQYTPASQVEESNPIGLNIGMILSYSSNANYQQEYAIGLYNDFHLNDKTFLNTSLLYSRSYFELAEVNVPGYTSQNLIFNASLNRYFTDNKNLYAIAGVSLSKELSRSIPSSSSYQNSQFSIMAGLGYDIELGNKQSLKIEGIAKYGRQLGLSAGLNIRYGF